MTAAPISPDMSTHSIPTVNILVALSCEAKPFVDFYRLTKVNAGGFPNFRSDATPRNAFAINLVVSGVGVTNMAAACGWLGALASNQPSIWLNCGVAGHKSLTTGEAVRVKQCKDSSAARSHYPPLVAKWSGQSVSLATYGTPCTDYPADHAVDMEASAFFAVANRFVSSELAQSIKIISDNGSSGIDQLNAARISNLIAGKITEINAFTQAMLAILPPSAERNDLSNAIQHLHCTASRLQQFQDLTNKLRNLGFRDKELSEIVQAAASMKQLLSALRDLQQRTAPVIGPGIARG